MEGQVVIVAALPPGSVPAVYMAKLDRQARVLGLREATFTGVGEYSLGAQHVVKLTEANKVDVSNGLVKVLDKAGSLMVQLHVESPEDRDAWSENFRAVMQMDHPVRSKNGEEIPLDGQQLQTGLDVARSVITSLAEEAGDSVIRLYGTADAQSAPRSRSVRPDEEDPQSRLRPVLPCATPGSVSQVSEAGSYPPAKKNKISGSWCDETMPRDLLIGGTRIPIPLPMSASAHVTGSLDEVMLRRVLREELATALKPFLDGRVSFTDRAPEYEEDDQIASDNQAVYLMRGRSRTMRQTDQMHQADREESEPNAGGFVESKAWGIKDRVLTDRSDTGPTRQRSDKSQPPTTSMQVANMRLSVTEQDDELEFSDSWRTEYHQIAMQVWWGSYMARIVDFLFYTQEPDRTGTLARLVDSRRFELTCSVMIILNAVMTFFSTNYDVNNPGVGLPIVDLLDYIFIFFYTVELALKLAVHQEFFFINADMYWNCFDFVLVVLALVDKFLQVVVGAATAGRNLTFLRALRILRMAKILRVFRLMRFLTELRLILNSLMGSMVSLFWSIVMMLLIFYMFALVFVQSAAIWKLEHADAAAGDAGGLLQDFGSVQVSMLSLYKATTGGDDWTHYYNELRPLGWEVALLFLFFVAFSQIALMNILTGLFVENAMKLAQPDREAQSSEQQRSYARNMKHLERIMSETDLDSNGFISEKEFRIQMRQPKGRLRTYLGALGIHEGDAVRFFKMLKVSSIDEEVEIKGFISGLMKLRGGAQSLDLQALAFEINSLHKKVHSMLVKIGHVHIKTNQLYREIQQKQAAKVPGAKSPRDEAWQI